jgi:hypothetical protein
VSIIGVKAFFIDERATLLAWHDREDDSVDS